MLYLDHAATAPVRPEVLEAMLPYLRDRFGNPSSHHTVGEAAAHALDDARRRVASVLAMRPGDVVFTSGGTEANNLALKGLSIGASQRSGTPVHLVTTAIEHESILAACEYLERVHRFAVTRLPVSSTGRIDADHLRDALHTRPGGAPTALVSVGYANNEVGTVQDVAGLAAVCREARVPLHLDAVQAAGWLPLAGTGADALSIAGHKIGAAPGVGVLAVRGRLPLEPLLHGGGQERERRSGTENVAGAVGFAVALERAEAERVDTAARTAARRDAFIARVLSLVPSARLTGDPVERLPGTASFTFAGVFGEAVLLELERRGIVSSSGSACAAGSDEPSHVLLALGIAPEVAQTAVRFTFGHGGDLDLLPVADAVADAVAAVRSGG
ncbi:cysteine desulfurase family protein [Microbacterium sp. T2.11-28]|uniref:cysteine desulfurase family protein n=1 Tax=Microbacterium sp. T2.11-28 TaxID=3041169 RepID=UPI002477B89C|nr:cysteine desulfurase family protein [Microbacterium sp. T2.11-28]CAI9386710.1 Cysteine desulfurase IscS [Microbacterium sp. T2.11-28]